MIRREVMLAVSDAWPHLLVAPPTGTRLDPGGRVFLIHRSIVCSCLDGGSLGTAGQLPRGR